MCYGLAILLHAIKTIVGKIYEENGTIIMEVKRNSKYLNNEILYINKADGKISRLIVQDNNNNTKIYIEYKEIEIQL